MDARSPAPPSAFLTARLDALLQALAARPGEPPAPVADLACGRGRNALAVAARGAHVIGVDRSAAFLSELQRAAAARALPVSCVRTDLESGRGIPLRAGSCGAILVFRFLFRPLAPAIAAALRPGGLLLYETFTTEQPRLGWGPRSPEFLLAPGELPGLFGELEILESWEGVTRGERPEAVARLLARRRHAA